MAQRWLVPVDGSETALKSIDWIVAHHGDSKETPEIHLLNVQPALPRDISRFVSAAQIDDFHRDEGRKALAEAALRLEAAGLDARQHVAVGESAVTIVEFAADLDCDQILVGTRGHTGIGGTLLGSVAAKVVHLARVPVLIVR